MIKNRAFYELSEPTKLRVPTIPTWAYLMIVVVVAFVSIFMSQIFGGLAIVAVHGLDAVGAISGEDGGMSASLLTTLLIGGFLPLFFMVWFWLWALEKRGLFSLGMGLRRAVGQYLRGFAIGLAMLGGAVGIMSVLGYTAIENPFNQASIGGAFLVLLGWIVQGAGEEVITRGFLLQIFGRMTNTTIGILVSSAIFMVLHAFNANTGFLPFLNLFLFGVFAAFYTLWEGGLWGIFAIHSVWNWAQGNLFGFEVSGTIIEDAVVLDLMETGPDVITGGAFGPEGGVVVTLVLVIAMALVVLADRRRAN